MRKIITIAVVLVVAFVFMRSKGLGFGDLMELAKGEFEQSRSDTKALVSGEYSKRMARELREEAAKMPAAQYGEGIDAELNRELAAERKRMMEERARNVQKIGAEVLKGDVETLKRRAQQNARQAGGSP